MAADLVRAVMKIVGDEHNVYLCCHSWYPKGEVLELVNEFQNLTSICNVRSDTVMFDLPHERTGKRGRSRKHGERLSFTDFPFKEVPDTDFYAGSCAVLTNLFGNRTVCATVTKAKKSGSFRLFLCTKSPDQLGFDPHFVSTAAARAYAETDPAFLPLTVYALRWQTEVA